MWCWWTIYIVVGFLMLGIAITTMQEEDGSMTRNGWIAAWISFFIWPIIILLAIGSAIGDTKKDGSTKPD